MDVKSDFAIWTLGFRRGGDDFAELQQRLAGDRQAVVAFLREQGFDEAEIEVRPLQVQDLLAREWGSQEVALRFNGQVRCWSRPRGSMRWPRRRMRSIR